MTAPDATPNPAEAHPAEAHATAPAATGGVPARRMAWLMAACAPLCCAMMAAGCWLSVMLFFESADRARLNAHLRQAQALLAHVDDTAGLTALPAQLQRHFAALPDVALRVQGPQGQPLYEQAPAADMPAAMLARPAAAAPAPLHRWRAQGRHWRGSALLVRMPLQGAAAVTVAVALDVQAQRTFLARMGWGLAAACALALLPPLALWRLAARPK